MSSIRSSEKDIEKYIIIQAIIIAFYNIYYYFQSIADSYRYRGMILNFAKVIYIY